MQSEGADLNPETEALRKAVHHGQVELARQLIRDGGDPLLVDQNRRNCLDNALLQNNVEMAMMLLESGMVYDKARIPGTGYLNQLFLAIRTGDIGLVEAMVRKGAKLETINDNSTQLLMAAVQSGEPGMVEYLIDAGVEMVWGHSSENNPFQTAIVLKYYPVALKFLEKIPEELGNSITSIEIKKTVVDGRVDVLAKMLSCVKKAHLDAFIGHIATLPNTSRWKECLDVALAAGATFNNEVASPVKDILLNASFPGQMRVDAIRHLMTLGMAFDPGNQHKEIAEIAFKSKLDGKVVTLLKEQGFNLDSIDKNKDPLLHFVATRTFHDHLIQLHNVSILLSLGADVNIRDGQGRSLLMKVATSHNVNLQLISTLIAHGADVTLKSKEGKTALHYLCDGITWTFGGDSSPNLRAISMVIEAGADVDAKTIYNETPISVVELSKFPEVKVIFEDARLKKSLASIAGNAAPAPVRRKRL